MSAVVADTHAFIWWVLEPNQLSAAASTALRQAASTGNPIYVASVSLVEICYLVEKGRLPASTFVRLSNAFTVTGTALVSAPLDLAIARAVTQISRDAVPDMPDRIIAATALYSNLPLVTRDRKIQAAGIQTIW